MPNKKSILIRVPAEVKSWLDQTARANSRSTSGELVHLLTAHFNSEQARLSASTGGQRVPDICP